MMESTEQVHDSGTMKEAPIGISFHHEEQSRSVQGYTIERNLDVLPTTRQPTLVIACSDKHEEHSIELSKEEVIQLWTYLADWLWTVTTGGKQS